MKKSEITALRLPPAIRERAEAHAAREYSTMSDVLRRAMLIGLNVLDVQAAQIAGNHGERREPVAS